MPAIDLNPAAEYGELVTVLPDRDVPIEQALVAIRAAPMADGDCVLAVGDVVFTAIIIATMAMRGFRPRVLRWDKLRREYDLVEVPW